MVTRFGDAITRLAFLGLIAAKAIRHPIVLGAHGLVVDRHGKVLLVRHSYMRGWSFPGGGVKRGEAPKDALMRELREELGGVQSSPPKFIGLFTRRSGWATNMIALYRLDEAEIVFRPNLEIREILFCDPASPPKGTLAGIKRRLDEFVSQTPPSPYW